jgi:periplasmic protein TonB
MAAMSGALFSPPEKPRSPLEKPDDDLLSTAIQGGVTGSRRLPFGAVTSIVVHVVFILALILVPIFWPDSPPDQADLIRLLIYNPPPPPPPPLPKGTSLVRKAEPAKPVTEETPKKEPKFTANIEVPKKEEEIHPEDKAKATEQFGSEHGSDLGVAEGMEEGVEGGVVGGVPGGVLGGCVGCTGDGPVTDYDQAPRPIKITRPQYPQDAFIKKIEGKVVLEILIDSTGHVVKARVVQSVPMLDQAAVQTVYQWVFSPAMKKGRPVATIALAPVDFRIF